MYLSIYLPTYLPTYVFLLVSLHLSFKFIEYLKIPNLTVIQINIKLSFSNFKDSTFTGIVDLSSVQSTGIC